jgi:hypothetical protein
MQAKSGAAILAIVCAIVAFFISPLWGFFLGLAAVFLGLIGLMKATSPRVSGGLISIAAMVLGLIAMGVKIAHGALKLIF